MEYSKAVDYINSFINFEKIPKYSYVSSFKLERMYAFLQELGNPHYGLRTIHIAGSKGKGSTCAIIASILKAAGYRVGLYTSPHLIDIRERIRILAQGHPQPRPGQARLKGEGIKDFDGVIEKHEFIGLIERIKPAAEKFRDHKKLGRLSFFELLTACAFLYFKEGNVDFSVLETGLGGRLDATNVTEPLVCGITDISFEHTDKLGNSLEDIAWEKAGIIKGGRWKVEGGRVVVSAWQEEEVRDVLRKVCNERKVRLYEIGKDITYSIVESTEDGQIFHLAGDGYSYRNLRLNLLGAHQVKNASLAIGTLKNLPSSLPLLKGEMGQWRCDINEEVIRVGLKNVSWPGRLQVVRKEPYVVLDGAQNVASIKAALSSIQKIFNYRRLICVFGISSDKDIEGVSRELDRVSDIIILTKSSNERAKEPGYLKGRFLKTPVRLSNNVEDAVNLGLETANKEDLILITGSLFVVSEALFVYKPQK